MGQIFVELSELLLHFGYLLHLRFHLFTVLSLLLELHFFFLNGLVLKRFEFVVSDATIYLSLRLLPNPGLLLASQALQVLILAILDRLELPFVLLQGLVHLNGGIVLGFE